MIAKKRKGGVTELCNAPKELDSRTHRAGVHDRPPLLRVRPRLIEVRERHEVVIALRRRAGTGIVDIETATIIQCIPDDRDPVISGVVIHDPAVADFAACDDGVALVNRIDEMLEIIDARPLHRTVLIPKVLCDERAQRIVTAESGNSRVCRRVAATRKLPVQEIVLVLDHGRRRSKALVEGVNTERRSLPTGMRRRTPRKDLTDPLHRQHLGATVVRRIHRRGVGLLKTRRRIGRALHRRHVHTDELVSLSAGRGEVRTGGDDSHQQQ